MMTAHKKNTAYEVALYFINKANAVDPITKKSSPITNKQLQKLLYYAQVWSLVINDEKLFPERIEAWIHGPAIPSVYQKFKEFKFNPIIVDTKDTNFQFTKRQKMLLDSVWFVYGKYDAEYLEALTHSELPWQEARKGVSPAESSNNIISLSLAKRFYAEKLRSTNSARNRK